MRSANHNKPPNDQLARATFANKPTAFPKISRHFAKYANVFGYEFFHEPLIRQVARDNRITKAKYASVYRGPFHYLQPRTFRESFIAKKQRNIYLKTPFPISEADGKLQ